MAIASLVLGILSIVIALFGPGFQWLGAILGAIGIVLGSKAKQQEPEKKGMAQAGFICSIIGTVLCLVFYVACIACVGGIGMLGSM